ncbi:hypothetical protein [Streptomyces boluensis]|uniref:hypothetical protein n=1 Tax=Streptomyces boluensis TaxID=1775135 RepID=UPI0028A94BED|nr:hypothetical protein [Streptomyces boluensis]
MATASAAAVCLGTLLAACGSESPEDDGYVAVGAVGASPERTPGRTVAPTGDVELVPLDEDDESGGGREGGEGGGSRSSSAGGGGEESGSDADSGSGAGASGSGSGGAGGSEQGSDGSAAPGGGNSGSGTGSSDEPSAPADGSEAPSGPAVLKVGEPVRKALEDRWCEKVTVKFRNSGAEPVRSGTVTFGTHVIGGLGIDWATVETERKLPVPIAPGEAVTESWDLCVDAWRVPLGMHIETQDVSVKWQ